MKYKEDIEKQIEEKTNLLNKLRKSTLKIILVILATNLVLPYIPLKNGRLIDQYGYLNAILFGAIVYVIIIPIAYYYTISKISEEINQLERDLELQKRIEKLKSTPPNQS